MERKKSSTIVVCIGIVLAIMLLMPTLGPAQPKTGKAKTLKIGYLLCLSGWFSMYDSVEARYLKAFAQMINEWGGLTIQGEKYNIELVGEDGKSSLDGNTAAATKLVFDHKVKFVIGPSAFFGPGSSPVFEPNKVLHVSCYITNQPGELDASTPYGFLGYNSTIGTTIVAIKAMKKEYPGVKKVSIVSPDDGAIPYLIPKVKNLLKKNGITTVGNVVAFPNQMEDVSPIAAKVNAIKDVDAVFYVNGSTVDIANIAKALRALGNNKPIVGNGLYRGEDFISVCGEEAADNIITVGMTAYAKNNPPVFDKLFEKAGKEYPIQYDTPNSLWVLAQVIEAANSIDPAVVKAKWESMDKVDTLFGPGIICGDEMYAPLKHHAVSQPQQYTKLVKGKSVFGGWIDVGPIP